MTEHQRYRTQASTAQAGTPADMVNHPPHYLAVTPDGRSIEAIEVVEGYRLGAHLSAAVTYILRAGRKTADGREDLRKARWWLDRAAVNGRDFTHAIARDAEAPSPAEISAAFGLTLYLGQALGLLLAPYPQASDMRGAAALVARELDERDEVAA